MDAQRIVDIACATGEGPLWHPGEHCLYWLDIPPGRLYRFDPATGEHALRLDVGQAVGGFTVQDDGSFLFFGMHGRIFTWDGAEDGKQLALIEKIDNEQGTRFNDVIADPLGGVFCGTMPDADGQARLYRLDRTGDLTLVQPDVGLSNGLAFSTDGTLLFHSDTARKTVFQFDYDVASGAISKRTPFLQFDELSPDGIAMDSADHLWVAFWNGGYAARFTPDGVEEQRIELPTEHVTSIGFGGDDLRDLYITTAGGDDRTANGREAGSLFRARVDTAGRSEFRSSVYLQNA